jgi:hypothetical protein
MNNHVSTIRNEGAQYAEAATRHSGLAGRKRLTMSMAVSRKSATLSDRSLFAPTRALLAIFS